LAEQTPKLFKDEQIKEDGRYFTYYSDSPMEKVGGGEAAAPSGQTGGDRPADDAAAFTSELRWHPFLGEWVIIASNRLGRTFLPPDDYCPFCPTKPGGYETEVPVGDYDLVAFANKFSSLPLFPPDPKSAPTAVSPVSRSGGRCEVILYSSKHDSRPGDMPMRQIYKLIQVWRDRYRCLGALPDVDYVYIFENNGREVGVTLTHPHGQIYAFPFIPPKIAREIEAERRHWSDHGKCLMCEANGVELADGRRIVAENDLFLAYVPFFARYTYEVYLTPRAHLASLADFDDEHCRAMAALLKTVLAKYDRLLGFPLPYIMVQHQRPTDGGTYPGSHFHMEFYPPHRASGKLKFLAGVESGAGSFINDTLPEEKAAELKAIEVPPSLLSWED
jgi:UDPglucose--hexose-1-phosphate uridylyltransferase